MEEGNDNECKKYIRKVRINVQCERKWEYVSTKRTVIEK